VFADATFAQRLKKLRLERGLKQKEPSLAAGLHKDLVYLWEREYRRPRRRSLGWLPCASWLGKESPLNPGESAGCTVRIFLLRFLFVGREISTPHRP